MTPLASTAHIHWSRAACLVSFFSLCSTLLCWPQVTHSNLATKDAFPLPSVAPSADPANRPSPGSRSQKQQQGFTVIREVKHDTGPRLREVAPLVREFRVTPRQEIENHVNPNQNWSNQVQADLVLQTPANSPSAQTPSFTVEFDGAGSGDGICCAYIPPDNDGAVGTTQYVQFVNVEYLVFDKSGNKLLGPLRGNAFWSGFGGECETENNGDPVIRFDAAAQRWVVSQFALGPSYSGPFYECVAVSQTDDATGAYHRYAFLFDYFPDYPKLAIWPDGYYFTFNNFPASGFGFIGADACVADRSSMLAGASATMQCFQQDSTRFGMLPSDWDGAAPPPAGTPNFVMQLAQDGSANLEMFQFHVDFATPANSTFTGPTLIPVAAFTPLCNAYYRGRCVPQPTGGSGAGLEGIGDRLMWRLVYRNFGDHSTLLAAHSIVAGSSGGVRWYEIRNPETSPTVFQSGTFAPDPQYRWMPSIAMDQSQDIAIGYSVSGLAAGQYPSIAYAGRVPADPAGTLESEVVMVTGLGSQTFGNRWGDYSSLTVDPTDDCTFWFTEEYLKSDGSWNWSTAIGSFRFPDCGASGTPHITSLSPTYGALGTVVTITGTNFGPAQGTSTVTWNGTTATSIASWSTTEIVTGVPAGATTGDVVVTVDGVVSNGSAFTVSVVPTISWAQPSPITYGATLRGILNAAAVDGSTPVPGTFSYTAAPLGGSASPVTDSTVLYAGAYTLEVAFTPTDLIQYTSSTGSVPLTVTKATPTVALASSANAAFAHNPVTFTATVSSSVSTPSGSVRFYDGGILLGSPVALTQGSADYATSSLTVGSHSVMAVYSGDTNFSTLSSSSVLETVEDFTLGVSAGASTSQTASPGGTANYSLRIAPLGGSTFPSELVFSVAGLPTGATATITPQTVAAGAAATTVSLSILVASQTASPNRSDRLALELSSLMAGMLLPFSGRIRRAAGRHRRTALVLLLASASLLGIYACGGRGSSSAQTYTVTMTATSGALSHSATLRLIVQ